LRRHASQTRHLLRPVCGASTYAGQICARTYKLKVNGQTAAPPSVSRDGHDVVPVASSAALDAAAEGFYYDAIAKAVWVKFKLDSNQMTKVSLM
jgi:hypothetical protein